MSGKLEQVLPVHHRIDGQRQIQLARPFRDFDLLGVRALEAGDAVGHDRLVALKTDLHVAQPGIGQRGEFFPGQQHGRGDQIGIQPDIAGVLHQFDQILARGRFAAGEMDLQHADFGELGEDLLPFLGRELAAAAIELDRVGAIGALQRTAMRQFGEHRERNAEGLRGRAAISSTASPSEGSLAATCRHRSSVGLMTSSRALRSEIPCRQGPAAWR